MNPARRPAPSRPWEALEQARANDPRLPLARALLSRWRCRPEGPAVVSDWTLLWPARRGERVVMLKLAQRGDDEERGGAFLDALGGRGAVRVLHRHGPALLMERIAPVGPSLASMAKSGRDDEATRLLGLAALRIRAAAVRGPFLIPWEERSRALRDMVAERRSPPNLTPALTRALNMVDEVTCGDRSGWTGLHGDLHHLNLLRDRRRGWLVLDPKGIFGPPEYEIANILRNPPGLAPSPIRMSRQADILAEAVDLPRGEVLFWSVVHAAFSVAWSHGTKELVSAVAELLALETLQRQGGPARRAPSRRRPFASASIDRTGSGD